MSEYVRICEKCKYGFETEKDRCPYCGGKPEMGAVLNCPVYECERCGKTFYDSWRPNLMNKCPYCGSVSTHSI